VIGGNGVTKVKEAVSTFNRLNRAQIVGSRLEERRVVDVGRCVIPLVELAGRSVQVLPHLRSLKNVFVGSSEHLRLNDTIGDLRDLITGRPDILKHDIFAILVLTKGSGLEVEVD